MTLQDVLVDGPPIRMSALAKVAGYSREKLRRDRLDGYLRTNKQPGRKTSPHMVDRAEARRWLVSLQIIAM